MLSEVVRLPASSRGPAVEVRNYSGYDARDLAVFVQAGLGHVGVRRPKLVVVTSSPIYTRGCATIAHDRPGGAVSIAIAAPSRFRLAKLARIVEHEGHHALGQDHGGMPSGRVYTSEASVPRWARGLRVRYRGKAPNQLEVLARPVDPRPRRTAGARRRGRDNLRRRRRRR